MGRKYRHRLHFGPLLSMSYWVMGCWIIVCVEVRAQPMTKAFTRMDTSQKILSELDQSKSKDDLLDFITELTNGRVQCYRELALPVVFNTSKHFPHLMQAASWVNHFLVDYIQTSGQNFEIPSDKGYKFLHRSITNLFDYEPFLTYIAVKLPPNEDDQIKILELTRTNEPIPEIRHKTSTINADSGGPELFDILVASNHHVYYCCLTGKWLAKISFPLNLTNLRFGTEEHSGQQKHFLKSFSSVMVLAIDITSWDVNQCAISSSANTSKIIDYFGNSAKCHKDTNECIFQPGHGWRKEAYQCVCRRNHYVVDSHQAPLTRASLLNTTQWESDELRSSSTTMPLLPSGQISLPMMKQYPLGVPAQCALCEPDCDICTNGSPCFYTYNLTLRLLLVSINCLCILLTLLVGLFIWKYRRVKMIRVASPKFLCITLLGAAVMYAEVIAIFFEVQADKYVCMSIEWMRHLGFCITYSALFMKTWRISGLFRVKSAHKIKLSDKQLLQWMAPIILLMATYLAAWSAGAPATPELLHDEHGLKYWQCAYGWWDHSIVGGNVLFLLWGIRVCYRVRKAESYFNEAKFISFAIYNIAGVNAVFLLLHLVVYPQASPDIKNVFAFMRIQLSTTVTVCLVFCPKIHAILRGQGENYEFRDRPDAQIPLNINGGPVSSDDVIDVYQENEDLKDEIQKLASQIEWMKIVHMNMGNRHLKPKHSAAQYHLAASYFPPSPILRSLRRRSSDVMEVTAPRLSLAAELASERV